MNTVKCFRCKTYISGEPVLDFGKGKIPNFTLHAQCARILFGLPDEPKIDFSIMVGPDVRQMADHFEKYLDYKGDFLVIDSIPTQGIHSGFLSTVHLGPNKTTSVSDFERDIEPTAEQHGYEPPKVVHFKRNKFERLKQANSAKAKPSKFFLK